LNRNLGSLNGIAILAVIFAHASGWVFTAMFYWTNRYSAVTPPNFSLMNTPTYDLFVFFNVATIFAVPTFLFMSGFFAAYVSRTAKGFTWKTVFTRLKELLIPYLIWSLVIFIYQASQGQVYPLPEYLFKLLVGKAMPHYYFVAVVVQLYIVARWVLPLIQKNWKLTLSVALIVQVLSIAPNYLHLWKGIANPIPTTFFTNFVFYFLLGAAVFYNAKQIIARLAGIKWWLLAASLIALIAAIVETEYIYQHYHLDWRGGVITLPSLLYAVFFMLTFLAFSNDLQLNSRAMTYLGQRAYGVYLIHPLILELVSRGIYHFLPSLLGWYILFFIVIVAVALSIPLALAWLARKSIGKYYSYLFG
jgi:peptidoglycan/LPS O-acetylase OafA/YrhL